MTDDRPQIYVVTPPQIDPTAFAPRLARLLDDHAVACVRLDLVTRDEDALLRACDALRGVTEPRDVALILSDHVRIAARTGLDGVHLRDGARGVRAARTELGSEAIVGAFCGASRHDGINTGEAGADYVAFGPVGGSALGDGARAERDLFAWWSEMIELPCVAEGALDPDALARIAPVTDFLAFGEEIWSAEAPSDRLSTLIGAL